MAFDFPSSPTTGQTYSVTGGPTYVYNGTAWVVLTPGNQFNRTVFTATAGQTTFTMNYVVGAVDVYRNGVKLAPADFTATNGTSIVLLNAATVGDTIEVISYPMITYSDAVKRTGDTMTGDLQITKSNPGVYLRDTINEVRAFLQFDTTNLNTVLDSDYSLSFNTNNIERMRIDVNGRVTKPYQPAFSAINGSPAQSAGVIQYGSMTANNGGHYNSSTYRFTAPVAGLYFFEANTIGSTGNAVSIYIRKNGSRVSGIGWGGTTTGNESSTTISVICNLAVGDYVDAYSNSSLYNNSYGNFCGHLIG